MGLAFDTNHRNVFLFAVVEDVLRNMHAFSYAELPGAAHERELDEVPFFNLCGNDFLYGRRGD